MIVLPTAKSVTTTAVEKERAGREIAEKRRAALSRYRGKLPSRKARVKDKRPLFCVALQIWDRSLTRCKLDFEYLHADDRHHARVQFTVANPDRRHVRIVEVAQVLGYVVEDEHGEQLSV